ncbi:50S ribosomal protein L30e [Sulfolobus sp. S-194]|uniref:50S ribosomal protein L30e n=1 Tax=Sulfolobus sp. S-194 TaxID=2512240 RepID=UPI001436D6C6|nr:50S ribosomal protein L30e [Sulfolobus sp. S-194]QIW23107.1 50S ribosomal protein L30e [Sulfolobus sp. S-194]
MSEVTGFESELKTLLRTGKVVFGSKKTIKMVKTGKVKMVIIASTLRQDLKDDILAYAKISNIPVYQYNGSAYELGTLCGKPFMISTIGVIDPGESRLLEEIKEGAQ